MASKVKENKKISKKRFSKKEVEIPVFVINKKKEPAVPTKNFSGTEEGNFWIAEDKDNLPVLERRVEKAERKDNEEKIENAWQEIKEQIRQKNLAVSSAENKSEKIEKKSAPLSEKHKRTILWVGVTIIATFIFFIWIYSLKNNFSGLFGSASYTFSRSGGVLEEAGNNLDELGNQLSNLKNSLDNQAATAAGEGVVDQLKEKILVEELKNKLEK